MNKKWIAYGVTGAVGLSVLAGGAFAAANAMDLRDTDGTILPSGAITGKDGGVLDRDSVQLRQTGSSVSVVTAPSVTNVASVASVASAQSAPAAPAPAAPAPAPVHSAPSVNSAPAYSAPSAASVASAPSN